MQTTTTIDERLQGIQRRQEELRTDGERFMAELTTRRKELARAIADNAPAAMIATLRQAIRDLETQQEGATEAIALLEADRAQLMDDRKVSVLAEAQTAYETADRLAVEAIERMHNALLPWVRETFLPLAVEANVAHIAAEQAAGDVRRLSGKREAPTTARRYSEGWTLYSGIGAIAPMVQRYADLFGADGQVARKDDHA